MSGTYATPFFEVTFSDGMSDYMAHPVRQYTILDIGVFNEYNTSDLTEGTMVLSTVLYSVLVVLFPLTLITMLTVLWLVPVPRCYSINALRFALWFLFCWNGLEVIFVIGALVVMFEFPYLYTHLVHSQYDEYCAKYDSFIHHSCPSLSVSPGDGLWLCLVTILGLHSVVYYTLHLLYKEVYSLNDEEYMMGNANVMQNHAEILPFLKGSRSKSAHKERGGGPRGQMGFDIDEMTEYADSPQPAHRREDEQDSMMPSLEQHDEQYHRFSGDYEVIKDRHDPSADLLQGPSVAMESDPLLQGASGSGSAGIETVGGSISRALDPLFVIDQHPADRLLCVYRCFSTSKFKNVKCATN